MSSLEKFKKEMQSVRGEVEANSIQREKDVKKALSLKQCSNLYADLQTVESSLQNMEDKLERLVVDVLVTIGKNGLFEI